MADVSTPHPSYSAAEAAWQMCRDLTAGARAVKSRGRVYLPLPGGMSTQDYHGYLQRAALFPAMGRTIGALSGAVFTRPPTVAGVPNTLQGHLEDLTFGDEGLSDVALRLVIEVLTVGRAGVLLDMSVNGGRPYWCVVPAESIINWRTARVGDDPDALVQLVIRENVLAPDASGFGHTFVPCYRELALLDGVFRTRIWRASDPKLVNSTVVTPFTAGEWLTPTRRGESFDFIPFTFISPNGVTPAVAKPPLEDLADVVVAHYRNSADHEHGLYLTALPTPWAAGLAGGSNQVLKIGPSVCWQLEKDGKAGLLEFTGAGLAAIRDAMAAKERQMAVLGGRLLLESSGDGIPETATGARMRYSAEAASLRTIAGAVSAALTRVLRWHVWWMTMGDIPLDVTANLTDEFFALKATPEEVKAALLLYQSDSISFDTFFDQLQKGGWTREGVTAAQERKDIERRVGA